MTLHEQFNSLAVMVLMGVWIGGSYSVYGRFIHPRKKRRWILLVTDPLFWIIQALLLFTLLLPVNEGRLRLYMFLGTILGFSFYKALLERAFLIVFDKIIGLIVRICRYIAKTVYQLIIYPAFFLLMLVYRLCRMTVSALFRITVVLLLFPLKVLRGFLRLILPEKWLIAFKNDVIRFHQRVLKVRSTLSDWWGKLRRFFSGRGQQ
ncbi:MAG: spore cortex biosynthesis protein YabQ [Sporolactobacillus sp.]